MNIKKMFWGAFGLLFVVGIVGIILLYLGVYDDNVQKTRIFLIKKEMNNEEVTELLGDDLKRPWGFQLTCKLKKTKTFKVGRYEIKAGMSSAELVNLLRSQKQKSVKITFNNMGTLKALAQKVAKHTHNKTDDLYQCMTDTTFLKKEGFDKATAIAMYLPDTYEVFWNISPKQFRKKMRNAYHRYWNALRQEKAKALKLSPKQVITLASIVHMESKTTAELATIAGLYLNRLRLGIPLQADPTVIFAIEQEQKTNGPIKRVLKKDLKINSPYNTYKHRGLPPGPIAMPDKKVIEAVLNAEKHQYLYMCASVDQIGRHRFAKSLKEHLRNARAYHEWIKKKE